MQKEVRTEWEGLDPSQARGGGLIPCQIHTCLQASDILEEAAKTDPCSTGFLLS